MSMIGKGNCKVYCRLFPMNNSDWDLVKIKDSSLYVKNLHELAQINNNNTAKFWKFEHEGIFTHDSQEFIYSNITKDVIDSILNGCNGIIIGYGQTGTGKSFTLSGLHFSELEFGIAPRLIYDLFQIKKEVPPNIKMRIEMSYVEFSKLNVHDLFQEFPNSIDAWHVKTANKIIVKSELDALKLLYKGEGRKTFVKGDEYMSHIGNSILTFHVTIENLDFSSPEKKCSRLHIVDMAGIDSVGNVSSNFKSAHDIGKANEIKLNMEQFIVYLVKNVPRFSQIKERASPLIYYLGSDLSSESVLRFIGHMRIQREDLKVTMSTLRFGQVVRGLKPKIVEIVTEITEEIKTQYLQTKLDQLKREKEFYSVLFNQDLTQDLDKNRKEHLQAIVEAYLHNRIAELSVLNVAEAAEVFKIFKTLCPVEEQTQSEVDSIRLRRTSKTDSRSSLKNSRSNKRLKKSRESVTTPEKTKPGTSITSVRDRKSTAKRRPSSRHSLKASQSHLKRIRSNSASLGKQSSVLITRKSTTSSCTKDKSLELKGYMTDTGMLPDILPKYEKAWNVFITDGKTTYKSLHEAYKANESELKNIYILYQKEVSTLQQSKDILERRKTEMIEAKMFQQFLSTFSPEEETNNESLKNCHENLDTANTKLLEQQELVLKVQSELKLLLHNRREIRQNLQEDFNQYCKDNYRLVIPDFGEEEEETVLSEESLNMEFRVGEEEVGEEEIKVVESIKSIQLDELKKIMEKELQKSIKYHELKNRTWKNLY